MAGIKEIRTRIASVTNTQKITSAMKMVSAAKLRKAQQAVMQMRPYAQTLQSILDNMNEDPELLESNKFAQAKDNAKILIVAISSNSGLCGGFNSSIAKTTIQLLQTDYAQEYKQGNVHLFAIGKKIREILKSKGYPIERHDFEIFNSLSYDSAAEIALWIMNAFESEHYGKVILVYNSFKNAATQIVMQEQFLPLSLDTNNEEIATVHSSNKDYILEPNREQIVTELIPRSLKIQFYSALLDSFASEHGARMTAMHKATDNAGSLLKSLKIEYNKARQASITNEILEIVSGANALQS